MKKRTHSLHICKYNWPYKITKLPLVLTRAKLDPKSIECILVRYSSNQKRYKCYSLITKRFYNSMVTFFEQHPYYSKVANLRDNLAREYLFWDNILIKVPLSFEIWTITTLGSNIFHQSPQTLTIDDSSLPQIEPLNNQSSTSDGPIELPTLLLKSPHVPPTSNSEICIYSRWRKI